MSLAVSTDGNPVPVLSLRNISVTFGGVKALQDVSFEVLPGEVQCIAGENGSGKSTLIKVITGVYQPLPGAQIAFAGHPVETMSPAAARADPRAKVKAMILSVLMPISFAASKLKDTARIAFPVFV